MLCLFLEANKNKNKKKDKTEFVFENIWKKQAYESHIWIEYNEKRIYLILQRFLCTYVCMSVQNGNSLKAKKRQNFDYLSIFRWSERETMRRIYSFGYLRIQVMISALS